MVALWTLSVALSRTAQCQTVRDCHGGVQGARESRCITSAFPSCVQRSDAHTNQREEEMDEGLHAHHGEEEKDGGTATSKATVSRTSQGHSLCLKS